MTITVERVYQLSWELLNLPERSIQFGNHLAWCRICFDWRFTVKWGYISLCLNYWSVSEYGLWKPSDFMIIISNHLITGLFQTIICCIKRKDHYLHNYIWDCGRTEPGRRRFWFTFQNIVKCLFQLHASFLFRVWSCFRLLHFKPKVVWII